MREQWALWGPRSYSFSRCGEEAAGALQRHEKVGPGGSHFWWVWVPYAIVPVGCGSKGVKTSSELRKRTGGRCGVRVAGRDNV